MLFKGVLIIRACQHNVNIMYVLTMVRKTNHCDNGVSLIGFIIKISASLLSHTCLYHPMLEIIRITTISMCGEAS